MFSSGVTTPTSSPRTAPYGMAMCVRGARGGGSRGRAPVAGGCRLARLNCATWQAAFYRPAGIDLGLRAQPDDDAAVLLLIATSSARPYTESCLLCQLGFYKSGKTYH